MPTKLNQIIAICNGKKSRTQSELTVVHHKIQKADLVSGLSRTYRPKDEDGERFPSEAKRPQYSVKQAIADAVATLTDLFDVVATQDIANTKAEANVVVDGNTILAGVPVTHLLFLEKQLVDIHTFVEKLPTLDAAFRWSFDDSAACYVSEPVETIKTRKVQRPIVKYEATKEHPAQTEMITVDETIGTWTQTSMSGAIPETQKRAILDRVRKLQDAVKVAREEANGTEVIERSHGKPVLSFIFGE